MNDTEQKLEQAFRNSLSSVLTEKEEIFSKLDDIKTVAGWYKEAKEDPKKIPSIIVNRIIEELLNYSKEHFINSISESIELQCEINEQYQVQGSIPINFKSLKPYVEFIKLVDGVPTPPKLRFTFKIDIDGMFEGLKFQPSYSVGVPTITREKRQRQISLDKFSFDLTVSIVKLPMVNLEEPIFLFHKEQFKVENLQFPL